MTGFDEFIKVFGDFTIANIAYIIIAIIFLNFVYRKFSDYITKKHDAEKEKDEKLKQALDAVSKYPEYRQQSIEIQEKLENEMQEIRNAIKEHTERLIRMENDSKKRELNTLSDRLMQSYRYYTDKIKNPLQAWTEMEATAFWNLFADYEEMGGDGYMHTIVQPAMQMLSVIQINDHDSVSELMSSRK